VSTRTAVVVAITLGSLSLWMFFNSLFVPAMLLWVAWAIVVLIYEIG
jgi:hypothetical protein